MGDDTVRFDPNEAQDVVPVGEYTLMVIKAEKRQSEGKEYPYVFVQFAVADGEYEGWPVTDNLSENPKARFRLVALYKAAGLVGKDLPPGEQPFKVSDLIGATVACKVKHEEYNGMVRARPMGFSMLEGTAKAMEAATAAPTPAPAAPAASQASRPAPSRVPQKSVKV